MSDQNIESSSIKETDPNTSDYIDAETIQQQLYELTKNLSNGKSLDINDSSDLEKITSQVSRFSQMSQVSHANNTADDERSDFEDLKLTDCTPKKNKAKQEGLHQEKENQEKENPSFLPLEDTSGKTNAHFSKQRPINLLNKALYHKEMGTNFFKQSDLKQAANHYELGIKKIIIAMNDDIFIWKIRNGLKEEEIEIENLCEEEKKVYDELNRLKAVLHNNLGMCYFKKIPYQKSKDYENKDSNSITFRRICIENCNQCINILSEYNQADLDESSMKTLSKAHYRRAKVLYESKNYSAAEQDVGFLMSSGDKISINLGNCILKEVKMQADRVNKNLVGMF